MMTICMFECLLLNILVGHLRQMHAPAIFGSVITYVRTYTVLNTYLELRDCLRRVLQLCSEFVSAFTTVV